MVNDKRLRIFLISIVTVHLWACAGFVDGSTDGSSREETRIDLLHSIAPPELSAKQRAELLLDAMTLREKIEFISGYEFFSVRPLPKLGLRSVLMSDATMGVRGHGRSTAFPAALAMAATWNTKLLHGVGRAIGEECRAKGIDVLLGPGINMYRIPNGGRNFEYFGEDPFLTSRAAVSYIEGVQDTGVVATVKHYIANNSDFDRDRMSSEVTERALREIYMPGFKASVQDAKVGAVMTAYNPVNGISASQNQFLINEVLKEEWGFGGYVVSDWISVYDTYETIVAGLDLEMPSGQYLNLPRISSLLEDGRVSETDIDEKVRRILETFFEHGVYDRPAVDIASQEFGDWHDEVALRVALEGIVLLKNEGDILPLSGEGMKKIVLVGENAWNTPTGGGGSSFVDAVDPVSFIEGLGRSIGDSIELRKALSTDREVIKSADVALVFVGFDQNSEREAMDRPWVLPESHKEAILRVAEANPRTIVVLSAGGGVETESWIDKVAGLLHCFYLGQSSGTALAKIVFGDVNPSGKLPFTMVKKYDDLPASDFYLPEGTELLTVPRLFLFGNKEARKIWSVDYGEGIFLGYRHFDTFDVEPQFPFGFGLSYTTFQIDDLQLSSGRLDKIGVLRVSVNITNTGDRAGGEVVQLYLRDIESSLPRPYKELKGFHKIFLKRGESARIDFDIDWKHLAFFDPVLGNWRAESGKFEVMVGHSSRQIASRATFEFMEG